MAEINHSKIMGQAKPAATTDTALYTVPALTEAQGTLSCCNQAVADDKVQIALVKSDDVLQVYSTGGNVSFTAGMEVV